MDQNAKQQAVEQIKRSGNVLVTVSANPSVDQLSAALGLTLMLNKMGKHTTAVVSGEIPPAISFLDPTKTFTNSVDGLRDFIIALDKEKADKLRYKVENDVVRIFITPYDGEITQNDLQFSQGDFNVDVVVALGVSNREDLDNAIKAHGRILHDASVVTINAGAEKSNLGSIDWQDPGASSLSEMMVSVSEAFQGGLLDAQISTALLTGIDAATDRFSNNKTSPKIMTMAAQLMAAGANQQLIANNLNVAAAPQPQQQPPVPPVEPKADDGELKLDHSEPEPAGPAPMPAAPALPPAPEVSSAPMPAPFEPVAQPEPIAPPPLPEPAAPALPPLPQPTAPAPAFPPAPEPPKITPIHPETAAPGVGDQVNPTPPAPGPEPGGKTLTEIEEEIAALATTPLPKKSSPPAEIKKNKQARLPDPPQEEHDPTMQEIEDARNVPGSIVGGSDAPKIGKAKGQSPVDMATKPMLSGTFNATSNDAHDEAERERASDSNKAILSHDSPPATKDAPAPAAAGGIDIDEARKAVEQAVEQQSFDPANHPIESLGATTMEDPDAPQSTEINIDPNGNISPAAPQPPAPAEAQTLAIPGAAPTPTGMPPQASESLDAVAPPPLPNPPGPLPPQ